MVEISYPNSLKTLDLNRLKNRVQKYLEPTKDGCLIWTGYVSPKGYGQITITGIAQRHTYQVHRVVATLLSGLPELFLDESYDTSHLCNKKTCVLHVLMESHADNMARSRKPFCNKGHARTEDNIYIIPSTGSRACRQCRTEYMKGWPEDACSL